MREIANKCRQCDEREIAQRPKKIFDVIPKNKKEINIADEVNDSRVQKK